MITGYVIPLVITIMTLITEFSAPECSNYKPRFSEDNCFFATHAKEAKIIWFYLPIGTFLLINTGLFGLTIYRLCAHEKQQQQYKFNFRNGQRNPKMEK